MLRRPEHPTFQLWPAALAGGPCHVLLLAVHGVGWQCVHLQATLQAAALCLGSCCGQCSCVCCQGGRVELRRRGQLQPPLHVGACRETWQFVF